MGSLKAQCGVISDEIFHIWDKVSYHILCSLGPCYVILVIIKLVTILQPQHCGCYDAPPQTVNNGHLMLRSALYNWCPCHKKKQNNCMCTEKIQVKPGVSLLDTKERDLRRNQIYQHIAHLATRV